MTSNPFAGYEPGLPMPRVPEGLRDRSRRPIVRTPGPGKRFPFPVPNGWFVVGESRALDPGEVQPRHVFGRDVVLFRTANGQPHLLDAYCAHLGAHIGVGGKVEGDCIRCPFHGWRYDGESGMCTEIPYTDVDRIPSQARVRSYPTIERNHMIWAWYHAHDAEPFYDVPQVAELYDPEWLPYDLRVFDVATCCQEMAENNADAAHFLYVHGSESIPENSQEMHGTYRRSANADESFVRESFGLGLGIVRLKDTMTFVSSTTPIDEENVRVHWVVTAPRALGEFAARDSADGFTGAVTQDLPIWENKRYVHRPVLTKAEMKILDHRQWSEQFYSDYTPE